MFPSFLHYYRNTQELQKKKRERENKESTAFLPVLQLFLFRFDYLRLPVSAGNILLVGDICVARIPFFLICLRLFLFFFSLRLRVCSCVFEGILASYNDRRLFLTLFSCGQLGWRGYPSSPVSHVT